LYTKSLFCHILGKCSSVISSKWSEKTDNSITSKNTLGYRQEHGKNINVLQWTSAQIVEVVDHLFILKKVQVRQSPGLLVYIFLLHLVSLIGLHISWLDSGRLKLRQRDVCTYTTLNTIQIWFSTTRDFFYHSFADLLLYTEKDKC
jgi:hypothetical protein